MLLWVLASTTARMLYLTQGTGERGEGETSPPCQALL